MPSEPVARAGANAFGWLVGAISCLGVTPAAAELTVDLARPVGVVSHRASGFLWGLSKDRPADALLEPLKIRKYRSRLTPWIKGSGIESFRRVAELGATVQVVVSDEYHLLFKDRKKAPSSGFGYTNIDVWPGDGGDFTLWETVIEDAFRRVRDAGLTVEWDVWEEPNWKGWWARDREQFFRTYARFHRKLRSLDPDAIIVGPSINKFDQEYLEAFLLYCKQRDVVPDILSWHEIIEQHRPVIIPRWVDAMKAFMAEQDIHVRGIDIGEYCSAQRQTSPGMNAMYLANLEVAGVHGACRACWRDRDGRVFNGWQPMLNGLLTSDLKPRSTWWVFRAYADLSGTLVDVRRGEWVHGIAGIDHDDATVRVLIGKNEYPPKDPRVVIDGFRAAPFVVRQGRVRVVAERIRDSGWEELRAPETILDAVVPIDEGRLTLRFPQLMANDALAIRLSRPR